MRLIAIGDLQGIAEKMAIKGKNAAILCARCATATPDVHLSSTRPFPRQFMPNFIDFRQVFSMPGR
jgi:hypothetical protein